MPPVEVMPTSPGALLPAGTPVPPLCSAQERTVRHSVGPASFAELEALRGCERIEGSLDLRLAGAADKSALGSLREVTGRVWLSGSFNRVVTPSPQLVALEAAGSVVLSDLTAPNLESVLPRLSRVGLGATSEDGHVGIENSYIDSLAGLAAWGPLQELKLVQVSGDWPRAGLGAAEIRELSLQSLSLLSGPLPDLQGFAGVHGLRALTVGSAEITSLAGLGDLSQLEVLNLNGLSGVTSLVGLPPLPSLRRLRLTVVLAPSLDGLQVPSSLDSLEIWDVHSDGRLDVSALAGVTSIGTLTLGSTPVPVSAFNLREVHALRLSAYPFADLRGLEQVTGLTSLQVSPTGPFALTGLPADVVLQDLDVSGVSTLPFALPARMRRLSLGAGFADPSATATVQQVDALYLSGTALTDLSGFAQLERALDIILADNTSLVDATGLASLQEVRSLRLLRNAALVRLPSWRALTRLDAFDLNEHASLTQVPPFASLQAAGRIFISDNPGLRNLESFPELTQLGTLDVRGNQALERIPLPKLFGVETSALVINNPRVIADDLASLAALSGPNVKIRAQVQALQPCPTPDDGVCDEPDLCAPGSDLDCRLFLGEPLGGAPVHRGSYGVPLLPRTGVPADAQLVTLANFERFCRREVEFGNYREPACASLREVLSQPRCAFVTQGCGLTRVEVDGGLTGQSLIRWYAEDLAAPVGISDGTFGGESIATRPVDCPTVEVSCNTCGRSEPACTQLDFPGAAAVSFSAIALDPAATSGCACEPQADGSSRISTECFCATFGCPTVDELEQRRVASSIPLIAEERICDRLEIQVGRGTGQRYTFDGETDVLLGAVAFGPNALVLPCPGTQITMGEPPLGTLRLSLNLTMSYDPELSLSSPAAAASCE
jgi:hypothetical protein